MQLRVICKTRGIGRVGIGCGGGGVKGEVRRARGGAVLTASDEALQGP